MANASGAAVDGPEALLALLKSSAGGGPAGIMAANPALTGSSACGIFWFPSQPGQAGGGWLKVGAASVVMGLHVSVLKRVEHGPANFADGQHLPLLW